MKNRYYLYILPLCAIFLFNGKKYDESVIERIHLDINICIEGQECGSTAVIAETVAKVSKGSKLYAGCIACHGAKGEGGIGPSFKGSKSDYIASSLNEYKNKIERGPQSALMYAQAAALSDSDIKELSKYIVSL
jgi:cytochrome c553|tara:strand:+ start:1003 stop:1404 length:402 start_codon:yes stop_codon:yes gene_type:complete